MRSEGGSVVNAGTAQIVLRKAEKRERRVARTRRVERNRGGAAQAVLGQIKGAQMWQAWKRGDDRAARCVL